MNIKHLLLSSFFLCGIIGTAHAQFEKEALLFSQEYPGGTARFKGMGNVQTALGGDLSSISGNPAGLGFYGQSDIGVTFNYFNNNSKTNYFGQSNSQNQGRFLIDNAGVVFHFPSARGLGADLTEGWLNFNVGLSYDKTNNFRNKILYSGTNNESTKGQTLADLMYTQDDTPWGKDLYRSFFMEGYPDINDRGYFPLAKEGANKYQQNNVLEKGDRSRTTLSFGANYSNKFYIGASFSMVSFKYETAQKFTEEGSTKNSEEIRSRNPNSPYLDPTTAESKYVGIKYALDDYYNQYTEGSGVDFKLGMIYKPAQDWNLGLTIKTPTWIAVQDNTNSYTDIYYTGGTTALDPYKSDSYNTEDDINIITPFQYSLGITKFFPRGLITADADLTDYSTTKFRSPNRYNPQMEVDMEKSVKGMYKAAINARIGGEYLITNIISGRAGFNYYGNPYKNADYSHYTGTLGLGVKLSSSLYMDVAVVHNMLKYYESPYTFEEVFWETPNPVAEIKNNRTNAVLTLGAKF
ncbi:OmpP1/FadL family transporter [Sphingobacterium spiritivorum]|uniref:OmpP1/FadL family transporter n=1 Tax=Sphingobacterium spiritivorum TaxID=258 RepID=UPI003DA56871